MSQITRDTVLDALAAHIGERKGASAAQLVAEITGATAEDPVGERALRNTIHDLRMEGYPICAHPTSGYYVAETDEELDRTCEYLYERALCSLQQISRMKKVSLPDLRGQLKLPT